jgi:hypothetical protein
MFFCLRRYYCPALLAISCSRTTEARPEGKKRGYSSNIFANDKKKRASGGMELKKNPNAKRQF